MTFGSLFSGAGGFEMGFHAAGLTCRWQVEIDPTARSVLERHYPGPHRPSDVRECGKGRKHRLAKVDVICGGFPCQNLSVAGRREGLAGDRSSLWWEMLRIVGELRPAFVVWENVPGLSSSDDGRDFLRVLFSIREHGYRGCVRTLDAQNFGVPQSRRRFFGVFAKGRSGAERACQVLAIPESLRGHPAPGGKAGEDVAGSVAGCLNASGKAAGSATQQDAENGMLVAEVGDGVRADEPEAAAYVPEVAFGLQAQTGRNENGSRVGSAHGGADDNDAQANRLIAFTELGESHATYQETETAGNLRTNAGGGGLMANLIAFGGNDTRGERRTSSALSAKGGTGRIDFETETFIVNSTMPRVCPVCCQAAIGAALAEPGTICEGCRFPIVFQSKQAAEGCGDGAPTLRAMGHDGSHANAGGQLAVAFSNRGIDTGISTERLRADSHGAIPMAGTASGVRRLTPRECEALMGWPADWTRYRADGSEIADGPRYRLCGNGVVKPIALWIGRRLMECCDHVGPKREAGDGDRHSG